MNILVVDDEAILRERLLSVLKKSGLPLQSCTAAENAFEAIEIVDREHPEIVITDIRMPSKSGLELAEYIAQNAPETIVILVTGYSEFEYARTAIRCNAFDYLLKPVESEKLIAVVLRAQKQLEMQGRHERLFRVFKEHFSNNLETIRRQHMEALLFHTGAAQNADREREVYGLRFGRYRLVAIRCGTAMDSAKLESEYYCIHLVEKYIAERLPKSMLYVFGQLVFLIWEIKKPDLYDDTEALLGFLRDLHAYVRRSFLGMLSAGISDPSDTLQNIQTLRCQASACLEQLEESGQRAFLLYEDIKGGDTTRWEAEMQVEALTAALSVSPEQALRQFDAVIAETRQQHAEDLYSVCLLIVSGACFMLREHCPSTEDSAALASPMLQRLGEGQDEAAVAALRDWLLQISEKIHEARAARTNSLVNAVRDYINTMYAEPVGLAEASRHVGRNPSYISRLVREHTGKSFTQLLTDKRMAEAKRLLKETSLKINEVAERTGYTNVRYFTRVFKATMNMSANDYRTFSTTFQ